MDAEFWLDRWRQGRTGWQGAAPGDMLVRHLPRLALAPAARVFVPLCGASPDIGWLMGQGLAVVGAELSGLAVAQLFDALGLVPQVTQSGRMRHHAAPGIDLYEGDFFDLTPGLLGPVDAIHDRAALFALPPQTRRLYAARLVAMTDAAPQLLTCLDHGGPEGPPFSVTGDEVAALYAPHYAMTLLEEETSVVFGTARPALNRLWHLARRETGHGAGDNPPSPADESPL